MFFSSINLHCERNSIELFEFTPNIKWRRMTREHIGADPTQRSPLILFKYCVKRELFEYEIQRKEIYQAPVYIAGVLKIKKEVFEEYERYRGA